LKALLRAVVKRIDLVAFPVEAVADVDAELALRLFRRAP
jgi:hypothetical protein